MSAEDRIIDRVNGRVGCNFEFNDSTLIVLLLDAVALGINGWTAYWNTLRINDLINTSLHSKGLANTDDSTVLDRLTAEVKSTLDTGPNVVESAWDDRLGSTAQQQQRQSKAWNVDFAMTVAGVSVATLAVEVKGLVRL